MDFEKIWYRIISSEGQMFKTKSELPFYYTVKGNSIITNRTKQVLTKNNFAKYAEEMIGSDSPAPFRDKVRGYCYIWAILNDNKII